MSNSLSTIRQSELLHRLVLHRSTAETFGKVEILWMHPAAHQVMGFVCESGSLLHKKRFAFKRSQILSVGTEGIIVSSAPVEAKAEQVEVLETLIGHELWSDTGNRLGNITDCLFNLETGEITAYLFRSHGWHGYIDKLYQLPTRGILRIGKARVLVTERSADLITVYQDGLEQKVSDDLQSLSETAQAATKRAGQQVKVIAEQATQKAKAVREDFPSQEALKAGQSLLEQFQERAQSIGQDLKEELSPFIKRVKASIQPQPPQSKESIPKTQKDWDTVLSHIPPEDLEDNEPWI
jgi:uncharacterized protein YrrD